MGSGLSSDPGDDRAADAAGDASRHSPYQRHNTLSFSLAAVVIGLFFLWLYVSAVNIPFNDDYDSVLGFLNQVTTADLCRIPTLLLQRHNEHVIVPLRIAALASKILTGSVDFRFLVFLGNASLILLMMLLWRELQAERRFAFLPCVFLLFQVQYWENTLIATCATENLWCPCLAYATFVVLNRKGPSAAAGAIGLAVLTLCTFGNGVLVFPIGLLMLLYRREYRRTLVWTVVLIPVLWLVLAKASTGNTLSCLAHPLASLHWFIVFLGSSVGHVFLPAAWDSPLAHGLSIAWGLAIMGVFVYMTVTRYYNTSAPLYAFFLFLILSGAIATAYRAGREIPFSPRYQFISILLTILGVVVLLQKVRRHALVPAFAATLALAVLFNTTTYLVNRDFVGFHKNRLIFELFGWLTHGEGLSYLGDHAHGSRVMTEAVGHGVYRIPSTEQMLRKVRLIRTDSEGYVRRGRMYCALRRYEDALRDFEHAIKVRPGYELAYRNRLLAFCMMGNREKALEDVRYLEEHGHTVPPEILNLIPEK